MKNNAKKKKRQLGQGLTEYMILVGIIAVGSMFVVAKFGESVKTVTGNMVNALIDSDVQKRTMGGVQDNKMDRKNLWESLNRD